MVAGEQSVALARAGFTVFRAITFLAAGLASERNRSAEREGGVTMAGTPGAARILPMNAKDEPLLAGHSTEEVQRDFFLRLLPGEPRPGRYLFRTSGLDAAAGTVILFQYEGRVIASATLDRVERFDKPERGTYWGALYFDIDTIRVFDPMGAAQVRAAWPNFKRFSQAKPSLDPKGYPAFERLRTGVEAPSL
jgi:hypothetical protein